MILTPPLAIAAGFEDTLAGIIAWIAVIIVPVIAIAAFWLVHILPEKRAHQRGHPQADAIKIMCLMSLFFGGLLWPVAFIWAYTKPTRLQIEPVTPGTHGPAGPPHGADATLVEHGGDAGR